MKEVLYEVRCVKSTEDLMNLKNSGDSTGFEPVG